MEWQPEQTIAKELFRFIDPEQPLREHDVFLPSVDFSVTELVWVGFWGLVFLTGVLGIAYGQIDRLMLSDSVQSNQGPNATLILLLASACLLGAYKTWHAFYWKLFRRRLFNQGRFRLGMFVLKDALLLHSMSQVCLIKKSCIHQLHVVHKGRGDPPELIIILHRKGHDHVHINLKIMKLDHTALELKKSLTEWINSGTWQIN